MVYRVSMCNVVHVHFICSSFRFLVLNQMHALVVFYNEGT